MLQHALQREIGYDRRGVHEEEMNYNPSQTPTHNTSINTFESHTNWKDDNAGKELSALGQHKQQHSQKTHRLYHIS